ncbi:hypothetical protein GDO81_019863 [Engystomops pustulosus]|uniref:Uncharacterized protein n=1 Tax=Engystomops pustulosus TaxID=76066 RepID=A0AAV6ZKZ9_ENGPU|nr:hypothetical protein GDO81_019863 [Engystomops pustulosus]
MARVCCTYCDSPEPAERTCLRCEASFCEKHLQRHSKSSEHILIDPTFNLEERKCPTHKEAIKYYCTMDSTCICVSCWVTGDHKGHQVEILDVASEKRRRLKGRVQAEISRQKDRVSLSVSQMIRQMELHKDELSKKIHQFEESCDITDPLAFLREDFIKGNIIDRSWDVIGDEREAQSLDDVVVSQILYRGLLRFADDLNNMKRRRQFPVMQKSEVLLDIDSAHDNIIISRSLRSASYCKKSQNRPDGPKRFESCQVFSSRSFSSGRHYWEVDVSQAEKWIIGVAGESLERKVVGNESFIGFNEKSWGLMGFFNSLSVLHNNIFTSLESESPVKVVGIYLDYEAGRLSFYQLCDPIRHLHTFTASFTEPLYAALCMYDNCILRIIK